MKDADGTRGVDYQEVMDEANRRYAEMVGGPLHKIESRQVKSLAAALVNQVNKELADMRLHHQSEVLSLKLQLREKERPRLGVPGE